MLIHLYLLLVLFAFVFFILGLKYGSFGSGAVYLDQNKEGQQQPVYMTKMLITTMTLLAAMVLFFILGAVSYDVTIPHCELGVNSTTVSGNQTTYTHTTICDYEQYTDDAAGDFFTIMGWVTLIMIGIFAFLEISGMVS